MNAFLIAIGLVLLVPITVLFCECFAALMPVSTSYYPFQERVPKTIVLVPAHNEAVGIETTLNSLLSELDHPEQVVVVADNCNDETATIARSYGVTVLERQDVEHRGKGYALDFGLNAIATNEPADEPDVVLIVDADCVVSKEGIQRLSQLAAVTDRPVQSVYLMERPRQPNPRDAISALAFKVKNLIRPSGLEQVGFPCLLTGTGMAIPWTAIRQVTLASGNVVEDMQLGVDLAIAGYPPLFFREVEVTGRLPQQEQAAKQQRKRWEHGHLQTLLTQVPRLLKASVAQKRFDLLAIALDLCVPPLSLLVMVWAIAAVTAWSLGWLGTSWQAGELMALEGVLIAAAIVGSWAKFAYHDLPIQALLTVPIYILWKIPLYLAFLIRPQSTWIRTERDSVEPPVSH